MPEPAQVSNPIVTAAAASVRQRADGADHERASGVAEIAADPPATEKLGAIL